MVVFTCQHCNASLKRVVVAKHYSTVCRKFPNLTCIDCLKDFSGDNYNNHTTCVTEDERYGDKNFKAKPVAVKQNQWIDIVHECATKNNNPKLKPIFSKLHSYTNVPRKKEKFLNFIKSSVARNCLDIATEVFNVIEETFLKNKAVAAKNNNENSKKSDEKVAEIVEKKDEQVVDESNETKKKKEKKKNKKNGESSDLVAEPTNEVNETEKVEKKRKRKHSEVLPQKENENTENGLSGETEKKQTNEESLPNGNEKIKKLSKKDLKKLSKKKKYEAELKNIEETKVADESIVEEDIEKKSSKPSKKNKKQKAASSEVENDAKRRKVKDEVVTENGALVEEAENEKENNPVKFQWEKVIKEVLKNRSDQEMPLKKLSKKVLAEYQTVMGDGEGYVKLIAKFNKKINKIEGVQVLEDKAKLLSQD